MAAGPVAASAGVSGYAIKIAGVSGYACRIDVENTLDWPEGVFMFGLGVGFIAIGTLSFVLPIFGRQFILVTLLDFTGLGSAITGFSFIGLGILLVIISFQNEKSETQAAPIMVNNNRPTRKIQPEGVATQTPPSKVSGNIKSRDQWFIQQTEVLLENLAQVVDAKSTAVELFNATKKEMMALKDVDIYSESIA